MSESVAGPEVSSVILAGRRDGHSSVFSPEVRDNWEKIEKSLDDAQASTERGPEWDKRLLSAAEQLAPDDAVSLGARRRLASATARGPRESGMAARKKGSTLARFLRRRLWRRKS